MKKRLFAIISLLIFICAGYSKKVDKILILQLGAGRMMKIQELVAEGMDYETASKKLMKRISIVTLYMSTRLRIQMIL